MVEELTGRDIARKELPDRAGDQVRTRAHIGKARTVLGFEPRVDLYSGLKKQVDWFMNDVAPVMHLL
jgi:nucleoside-diphosphate-sugar epimerase